MTPHEFLVQNCTNIKTRPVLAALLTNILGGSDFQEQDLFYLFVVDHFLDIPFLTQEQAISWVVIYTGYLRSLHKEVTENTLKYPAITITDFRYITVDGIKWFDLRVGAFLTTEEMPQCTIHAATMNLLSIYSVFKKVYNDNPDESGIVK